MNPVAKARANLHKLQKEPDNNICMDCGARDPRWASVNLGIFICINCAGAHRTLGTHISNPKSIDQDNWTLEQVEQMRKRGNANAKKYFEATMKPGDSWETGAKRVVSENIAAASFMRRKYEYKEFTPKKQTGLSSSGNSSGSASPPLSPRFLPAYAYENPKPKKPVPEQSAPALVQFEKTTDLLTDDFKPRGEVTKSDIMQLFDPKLQPTQAPAAKYAAPPTPSYPSANYDVHINAPAPPNPFLPNYTPVLSPNPFTAPPSPYGNPPYANPNPAFYSSPNPAPYSNPNPAFYSNPNTASYSSPNPLRPAGPDPTVPLPPRTNPFASLPAVSSPPLTSSYNAPLPSSYGTQPLSPTFGGNPQSPRAAQPAFGAHPLSPASPSYGAHTSSFGTQPLNSSFGLQPVSPFGAQHSLNTSSSTSMPNPFTSPTFGTPQSPAGHQIGRPNYGTPMPANYAQPPNPFLADDPNYIASQFNFR